MIWLSNIRARVRVPATAVNGAALEPPCPASVDAGDILIAHVQYTGTSNAPDTPADWTPLYGPVDVDTTVTARTWCFGKIAIGDEDGDLISFGTESNTTMRLGRIYSFSGRVSGTITDLCVGFVGNSQANDPVIQQITTSVAGAKAVALVSQDDDNSHSGLGAVTGGSWAEAVADFLVAGTAPAAGALQLQVGTPTADPGTIAGGTVAGTNDGAATITFEIRPNTAIYIKTGAGVALRRSAPG